jgi:hypothetical protein
MNGLLFFRFRCAGEILCDVELETPLDASTVRTNGE